MQSFSGLKKFTYFSPKLKQQFDPSPLVGKVIQGETYQIDHMACKKWIPCQVFWKKGRASHVTPQQDNIIDC